MRITKFYLIIFLLNSFTALSQNNLTGIIISEEKKPLGNIEIRLLNLNNQIINTTYSDTTGHFEIKNLNGKYYLQLNKNGLLINYNLLNIDSNINLGYIYLEEKNKLLEEVIIKGDPIFFEQKVDRFVLNIENIKTNKGYNLLEILNNSPHLTVKKDGINIIGKGNSKILIDNRQIDLEGQKLISYINSISIKEISSIEIIRNPSSKFSSDSFEGIININLKKAQNNTWNYNFDNYLIQTKYPFLGINNTFLYSKIKFKLKTLIGFGIGNEGEISKYKIINENFEANSKTDKKHNLSNLLFNSSFEYLFNKKNEIGGVILLSGFKPDVSDDGKLTFSNKQKNTNTNIITNGYTSNNNINFNSNIYYKFFIDSSGKKIEFNLDLLKNYDKKNRKIESNYQPSTLVYNLNSNVFDNLNNLKFSFNFENQKPNQNLEIGGNISHSIKTNELKYFENSLYPSKQTKLNYKENINSIYLDYFKKINLNFETKIGIRIEETSIYVKNDTINFNLNYINLFPTLFLNYKSNDNNNFNLNLSKGINRPNYWELNPFKWYLNKNSYSEGNPYLLPSYSYTGEIVHNWRDKFISIIFFQHLKNGFGQIPLVNSEENIQIFSRDNYFSARGTGIIEIFYFNLFTWWKINNQIFFSYSKTFVKKKYSEIIPSISGINSNFSTKNSFQVNNKNNTFLDLDFSYNFPNIEGIYRNKSSFSLDLSANRTLIKDKLFFSCSIIDLFRTSVPIKIINSNKIKQEFKNYYSNRYLKLSITYNIGNSVISLKDKKFKNNDITERIKKLN